MTGDSAGAAGGAAAVTLRPVVGSDIAALAEVFSAAWQHGYPGVVPDEVLNGVNTQAATDVLAAAAKSTTLICVVAEIAGAVAGFVRFGADEDATDDRTGYIAALYVHPSYAGRGVGRALVAHALDSLERGGRPTVRLWVFTANEPARRLYSAAGFVPDGAGITDPRWQTPQIRLRRNGDRIRP